MNFKILLGIGIILLTTSFSYSQSKKVIIKGIVVDSISLASLPNITVQVKGKTNGTISNANGSFIIEALDVDTLIFSSIGYRKLEYPLFDDEDEVLIRMRENYVLLKEVTALSPHVDKYVIKERPIVTPSLAEGIFSPFTYFSKTEKEKRKLVKLREENKKIKTYVQIVNDPDLKDEIMEKFRLKEKDYYEILAKFNQQNRQAAYMNNPVEIHRLLLNFFRLHAHE